MKFFMQRLIVSMGDRYRRWRRTREDRRTPPPVWDELREEARREADYKRANGLIP